jgi:hypothetical protein
MLFIFSTPELIRNLWQLKTAVLLHWCLKRAVLLISLKRKKSINNKKRIFFYVENSECSKAKNLIEETFLISLNKVYKNILQHLSTFLF